MIVIPKNAREEIRVERQDYQGHDLVQMRVWFDAGGGEMRPTKKGIAIRVDQVAALQAALVKVTQTEGAE